MIVRRSKKPDIDLPHLDLLSFLFGEMESDPAQHADLLTLECSIGLATGYRRHKTPYRGSKSVEPYHES